MARILIVDDDAFLLRFAESYLRKKGFEVECCRSTAEAWSEFGPRPDAYQLALVDATLGEESDQPGSSKTLARRIWDLNPSVAVLFWSGYPFDVESIEAPAGAALGFLQKPFTPAGLVESVVRLLGRASDSSQSQARG